MPRKQLNIGLTPVQYEVVRVAAEEEGVTVTVYCRDAVMEKAAPAPVVPDVAGPAGLVASRPAHKGQDAARYAE